MNLEAEKAVYAALKSVYSEGAFSTIVLNRVLKTVPVASKSYITRLFYGVLDKSIQLDYIIMQTVDSKPKTAVVILLKIGLYLLRYSDTPKFAAVNKTVELAKQVGKRGTEGFINAVLKKSETLQLPQPNNAANLSVYASYPVWVIDRLVEEYGFDFARDFVLKELTTQTHIRPNLTKMTQAQFEAKYPKATKNKTDLGYYVSHTTQNSVLKGDYVIQSYASMRAVQHYLKDITPLKVLDVCAAPGGKAAYIKSILADAEVTACDVHAHRVDLINSYAQHVGVAITARQSDATIAQEEFKEQFELVVCDVPCSGIGVVGKKPEILLRRTGEDVQNLAQLQRKIIQVASGYVAKGGRLSYSTCTVFKEENDDIVNDFLSNNPHFTIDGEPLKLFPHIDDCDGFYVVNLKRNP